MNVFFPLLCLLAKDRFALIEEIGKVNQETTVCVLLIATMQPFTNLFFLLLLSLLIVPKSFSPNLHIVAKFSRSRNLDRWSNHIVDFIHAGKIIFHFCSNEQEQYTICERND